MPAESKNSKTGKKIFSSVYILPFDPNLATQTINYGWSCNTVLCSCEELENEEESKADLTQNSK